MTRKSRRRDCIGGGGCCNTYRHDLLRFIRAWRNGGWRSSIRIGPAARWPALMLIWSALLMAWSDGPSLGQRLDEARRTLTGLYPGRRRVGCSYTGWAKMMRRWSPILLRELEASLRSLTRTIAGAHWRVEGWELFGVDGTKLDLCPTAALERCFGTTGKRGSGPQAVVTALMHLGSGVLWGYRVGPLRGGERGQLRAMMHLLPLGSLLVADAGFTGHGLLTALTRSGRFFLIRAGANVTLLRKLKWAIERRGDYVYLWPDKLRRAGKAPLVLRLIRVPIGRGQWMSLLTNVLDPRKLSERQAVMFYRMRWGLETTYRTLKQTLGRRKMLSQTPALAALEVRWSLVGLWVLQTMSVKALVESGQDPLSKSMAAARRAVRGMLGDPDHRLRVGDGLATRLVKAVRDDYVRHGPKATRAWARKKEPRPPGEPPVNDATSLQIKQAQRFEPKADAA